MIRLHPDLWALPKRLAQTTAFLAFALPFYSGQD